MEENFKFILRNELDMPLVLMERGKWMQVEERHCSQHWRCERVWGNQEAFFTPVWEQEVSLQGHL